MQNGDYDLNFVWAKLSFGTHTSTFMVVLVAKTESSREYKNTSFIHPVCSLLFHGFFRKRLPATEKRYMVDNSS